MIQSLVATVLVLALPGAAEDNRAGGTVAIVPVAGERVTLEEVPLFERVDALLRGAAQATGTSLQPAATTKAHLGALRDAGIDCDLADRNCLAKVAVLAEVARLLVPVARREGNVFHMTVLVVDGSGRAAEVAGDVSLSDDDDADRALATSLVRAALAAPLDAAPAPAPAAPATTTATAPAPPSPPPPAAAPTPWLGITVLGASGAIALASGIGLAVADASLGTPAPYEERQTAMALGQACFVGVLTGAVGAGVGGLLLALGE